jgi:hypothetical protein
MTLARCENQCDVPIRIAQRIPEFQWESDRGQESTSPVAGSALEHKNHRRTRMAGSTALLFAAISVCGCGEPVRILFEASAVHLDSNGQLVVGGAVGPVTVAASEAAIRVEHEGMKISVLPRRIDQKTVSFLVIYPDGSREQTELAFGESKDLFPDRGNVGVRIRLFKRRPLKGRPLNRNELELLRLEGEFLRARLALADQLAKNGVGDEQIRERIQALNGEIKSISAARRPFSSDLLDERERLRLRLTDPFLERKNVPAAIEESHRKMLTAKAALEAQRAIVEQIK